jgi:hypothetical protein
MRRNPDHQQGDDQMEIVKKKPKTAPILGIHGQPASGKTFLASKFDKPLFIFTQGESVPGGVEVDCVDAVKTSEDLFGAMGEIYRDPCGYRALVFDTLGGVQAMFFDKVCRDNRVTSVEKIPYGKGVVFAEDYVRRLISASDAIRAKHDMTIVYLMHTETTNISDPRAPAYMSYQPMLHRRVRDLIVGACDVLLFIGETLNVTEESGKARATSNGSRYLFSQGCPAYAAKSRYAMPARIELPLDFQISGLTKYWAG